MTPRIEISCIFEYQLKQLEIMTTKSNKVMSNIIITDHSRKKPLKDCMFKVMSFIDGTKHIDWILPLNEDLIKNNKCSWFSFNDVLKMENFKYKVYNGKYQNSNHFKPKYIKCRLAKTIIKKIEESRNIK